MSGIVRVNDTIILFARQCTYPYENSYGKCYKYFVTVTNIINKRFINYYYRDSIENYIKNKEPDNKDLINYLLTHHLNELATIIDVDDIKNIKRLSYVNN